MTTTGTLACSQPGCAGVIEDGFCSVCGLAPPRQPDPRTAGPAGSAAAAGTGGPAAARTRGRRTRPTAAGQLGAGLVQIAAVSTRDPSTAVMSDPRVPESRRYCGSCDHEVGRGRSGEPGRTEGFCPACGTPFSFSPKLAAGDVVAGQYEVAGPLAHGGLGWIYLARDRHLNMRWVVLKGLLNSEDSAAQAAAVAERRFLAEVQHPGIVGVYNFVEHPDPRTGALTGYIVMEFVGGQSLRQILAQRRAETGQSLPVAQALAYAIDVLPALGYLHDRGLVYCDFKPDNVIQVGERMKLIDMGAVRHADDEDSPVFGTVGFQAPEIATDGPTPSSDLYTVGRSLAVLTFDFPRWRTEFAASLPDPATVEVLARHDSYRRALARATHPDPARRFASAAEMAEQLTGVLREVLAVADGQPRPAFSALFTGEVQAIGAPGTEPADDLPALAAPDAAEITAGLPVPAVDAADPAAGFLATLSTLEPAQRLGPLAAAARGEPGTPPGVAGSPEIALALARAAIVSGDRARAAAVLAGAAAADPADWRVTWYQALAHLAGGQPQPARAAFGQVLDILPGELAPKLALALAAEAAGDLAAAAGLAETVWTVDRGYVSAAFGLARLRLAAGNSAGAVAVLCTVPESSSQHLAAQVAAIRLRLTPPAGQQWVPAGELHEASRQLTRLRPGRGLAQRLTTELLQAALARVTGGQPLDAGPLLGIQPTERAVRLGLEQSYRDLARLAPDPHRKVALVDLANNVRPRTWA